MASAQDAGPKVRLKSFLVIPAGRNLDVTNAITILAWQSFNTNRGITEAICKLIFGPINQTGTICYSESKAKNCTLAHVRMKTHCIFGQSISHDPPLLQMSK
jgi:hypothetical protein